MTITYEDGYALPDGDQPLTNARILHSGNTLSGTITTSDQEGGPAVSADNWLTYERWIPFVDAQGMATWTITGLAAVDCACIGAHNLAGGTVTVRVQQAGVWSNVAVANPTDNSPIMFLFAPILDATAWRIRVEGVNSAAVGVIKFGKTLQMTNQIRGTHSPIGMTRNVTYRQNNSGTGEWLGRTTQRISLSADYSWTLLDPQWVRDNWLPATLAMEQDPFFIAWMPGVWPDVGLVYTTSPATTAYQGTAALMQASIQVTGFMDD